MEFYERFGFFIAIARGKILFECSVQSSSHLQISEFFYFTRKQDILGEKHKSNFLVCQNAKLSTDIKTNEYLHALSLICRILKFIKRLTEYTPRRFLFHPNQDNISRTRFLQISSLLSINMQSWNSILKDTCYEVHLNEQKQNANQAPILSYSACTKVVCYSKV